AEHVLGEVCLADGFRSRLGIDGLEESSANLLKKRFTLVHAHDARSLPPSEIKVQTVQPDSVRSSFGLIDVAKIAWVVPPRRIQQRQVAVLFQPSIEMKGTAPRSEAMIGHDDQGVRTVKPIERFANKSIDINVELLDDTRVLRISH